METMKAQLLHSYGEKPDFHLAEIPLPALKPGHVLVRVAATSVNPIDIKIRKMRPVFAPALPAILGMDVAGTVESVGQGVTDFKPGDEVFGCAGGLTDMPGALAQFTLADARLLALKPANLTMVEAAALPLVGITAWDALFDRARIQAGQSALIHAGTGGVGHVAVQLAKSRGARVATTVSSAGKAELAKSLGADEIINYREALNTAVELLKTRRLDITLICDLHRILLAGSRGMDRQPGFTPRVCNILWWANLSTRI